MPRGGELRWSTGADGLLELFSLHNAVWSVSIASESESVLDLAIGEPERLPVTGYRGNNYDVSPDGRRFVFVDRTYRAPETREIVVIPGWFEELKRLVPTGR